MKQRNQAAVAAAALASVAGMACAQVGEAFDDITMLNGWTIVNHSAVVGAENWFQGNTDQFGPQATSGYIAVNYESTAGANTISDWLIMPQATLHNGDSLSFWTRTVDDPSFPDRLQVRMSTAGASSNVGTGPTDVGDFTNLLLDINPNYDPTMYPSQWTQFTVTLSGLPAGGASGRIAFRYFVEDGGPAGNNSDYIGLDSVSLDLATAATGACCLDTGCTLKFAGQCVAQGGIYRGDGITCAASNCPAATVWVEQGDAGDLPATAQVVTGPNGPLLHIRGALDSTSDADLYQIQVCAPSQFSASTVGGSLVDTKLALFDSTGHGVTYDDDDPANTGFQSALSSQFVHTSGLYYLAIASYGNVIQGATSSHEIWQDAPLNIERQPDGTAAAEVLGSWSGEGTDLGIYDITLTGACFAGTPPAPCYANCDSSTTIPFLNVNDFICFQSRFAAGDSYANCDASTTPPVLNVNDFICFQTRFAAGCSAP